MRQSVRCIDLAFVRRVLFWQMALRTEQSEYNYHLNILSFGVHL